MVFKIMNIEDHHKDRIHKLIEAVNQEDHLNYSLTNEWLDYIIQNAGESVFLGFDGEKLAGLGTAMINSVYKDQAGFNIVVGPQYRKQGLASILYDQLDEFAKKNDVKIVEAYVKQRLNHGVKFADKRAFNIVMYSWEMELDLNNIGFNFEELPGLNFRKAGKDDSLNYKRIILDGFGDELEDDALMESLKDSSVEIYILEKQGQAIGSATVQLRKDLSLAYIYDIAILKDYRGQGWGSYLLKSSITSLKEKSLDRVSLSVTGENQRALDLYRKIGFKEIDIDLIMVKEIKG